MLLAFVLCFVFLLIALNSLRKKTRYWQCLQQIPQPRKYLLVGNLFDVMLSTEKLFLADRERGLKFFPIYMMNVLNVAFVNLVSPEDMELVMTDMRHITKGFTYDFLLGWLGTGLLTSTGGKWQSRRKLLTPAFHFNILQEFIKVFNEETKKLVEDLEQRSRENFIDVVGPITHFTLTSIAETAMGITLDTENDNNRSYKDAVHKFGEFVMYRINRPWLYNQIIYSISSTGKKEKKALEILHDFTSSVISNRKSTFDASSYSERKRLAMLDLLLKYKSDGANIDNEGIREEVDTFMFEGHDTTSMAICFALMVLANHEQIQEELYQEIQEVLGDETPTHGSLQDLKLMERCIKESLRLYPSVPTISRITGAEIKTHSGYTIPKDCTVNMHIYDLHHNPNVFPDPEKFDPDRFLPENVQQRHPFAYIPFSAGPRNCIGQKLAMQEMKVVLCGILKKFVMKSVDTPKDIEFITDLVLRPKGSIKVKFVPRTIM